MSGQINKGEHEPSDRPFAKALTMKYLIATLVLLGILGTLIGTPKVETPEEIKETPPVTEIENVTIEEKEVDEDITKEEKVVDNEPVVTWKDNPNNCEPTRIRADNLECLPDIPKQKVSTYAAQPTNVGGTGSCEAELAKYDWNLAIATGVMLKESGGNPGIVNDNPATGDYSVGCMQINLYGANAASRPSEAWLKNAANNVSYAYGIYKSNGSSFIGQWGACRHVACY